MFDSERSLQQRRSQPLAATPQTRLLNPKAKEMISTGVLGRITREMLPQDKPAVNGSCKLRAPHPC